jgi:hypothetical protein
MPAVKLKPFYNAGKGCQGCGAPLLTNGTYCKCEYCGGGLVDEIRFKAGLKMLMPKVNPANIERY